MTPATTEAEADLLISPAFLLRIHMDMHLYLASTQGLSYLGGIGSCVLWWLHQHPRSPFTKGLHIEKVQCTRQFQLLFRRNLSEALTINEN